ncbi:hypothetical protein [Streptomyces ferrugineus]|nr:hypothetical protein [Streptomyces ferrugineus]
MAAHRGARGSARLAVLAAFATALLAVAALSLRHGLVSTSGG